MSEFSTEDWASPRAVPVYRDAPAATGNLVTYAPGTLVSTDVYEEFTANNTSVVSFRLAVGAGSIWPTLVGQ